MVILRAGEPDLGRGRREDHHAARPRGQRAIEDLSSLRDGERQHIVKALARTRGVLGGSRGAAAILGLPRSTLQYRIRKLRIQPQDYLR